MIRLDRLRRRDTAVLAVLAGSGWLSCLFRILDFLDFWLPIHNPNPGLKNIVILHPYQKVILHPYQLPFQRSFQTTSDLASTKGHLQPFGVRSR